MILGGEDAQYAKKQAPAVPVRTSTTVKAPVYRRNSLEDTNIRYDQVGNFLNPVKIAQTSQDQIDAARWGGQEPAPDYTPGGGGSGSGYDQNQQTYDALGAYLKQLQGQDVTGIYDTQLGNVADSYGAQIGGANTRYDGLGQEVGGAGTAGRARMGDIVRLMQERGMLSQQAAQQSFGQAGARLSDLGLQFGMADQGNAEGVNKILSAFDAGSVDAMAQPTQNLFQGAQMNNQAVAGMYDQNFVDRAGVSDNIGQDINRQLSAQEQSLMNQIAVKRADEIRQLQQAQQAQEFALQQQRMAAEQAQMQAEAQVQLEMARLGIVPKPAAAPAATGGVSSQDAAWRTGGADTRDEATKLADWYAAVAARGA